VAPRPAAIMGLLSLLFGCKSQGPFEKRDGVWYYRDEAIANADARTFEVLSDHYAKDRSHVYYADTYREGQEYFTKRHSRVDAISGADAATFRYLDQGYARDTANVYFEGARFVVSDAASFELLDYGFAKDRLTGYYQQAPVPGSDGRSFAFVDNHYSKDATNAFYSWLEPGTNGGSPVPTTLRIAGALPTSFTALEFGYAADSARVYFKGNPLTNDPASFRVLRLGYAVSKDAVFYDGVVVPGADASTFAMLDSPTDSADARDAKRGYRQGRRASGQ